MIIESIEYLGIIGFGCLMIKFKETWAALMIGAQKKYDVKLTTSLDYEKNQIIYAKRLTGIVGVVFILYGIFSIMKLLIQNNSL